MKINFLWMVDAVYALTCIGQSAFLIICIFSDLEKVLLTSSDSTFFVMQLFYLISITTICTSIALGALSFFSSVTQAPTGRMAMLAIIVCFFPFAFIVHYGLTGRNFIRGIRVPLVPPENLIRESKQED